MDRNTTRPSIDFDWAYSVLESRRTAAFPAVPAYRLPNFEPNLVYERDEHAESEGIVTADENAELRREIEDYPNRFVILHPLTLSEEDELSRRFRRAPEPPHLRKKGAEAHHERVENAHSLDAVRREAIYARVVEQLRPYGVLVVD